MKNVVVGSLLAALAMFVWGFVFWGANPLAPIGSPDDDSALREALVSSLPGPGVYFVPSFDSDDFALKHASGPIARIFFQRDGAPVMNPVIFVFGFVHMFVITLLLSFLLAFAGAYAATYRRRVMVVGVAGLAAAIWSNGGDVVWFYSPWAHHLSVMLYDFVAFVLAGLILARFVGRVEA